MTDKNETVREQEEIAAAGFPGEEIPEEMWPEIILAAKKHIPIRVFEDGAMEE